MIDHADGSNGLPQGPSLCSHRTENGYVISEHILRFATEAKAETILRAVGIAILSVGIYLSATPINALTGDLVHARWTISSLFLVTGLGLFAFATRGFRKVIYADLKLAELRYGRLNGFGKTRITHHVPMNHIEKLTTQPGSGPFESTSLNLHLAGRTNPIRLITGRTGEVERLRTRLAHDIRQAVANVNSATEQQRLRSMFQGKPIVMRMS